MTTKKEAIQAGEGAATAKFVIGNKSAERLVGDAQQILGVVKTNERYADPTLKQAVTAWQAATDAVDASDQAIKSARLTLAGLLALRAKEVTGFKRATRAVLSAVDTVAAGSARVITQLGFALEARLPVPPSMDPPSGLRAKYTKSLVLVVKWDSLKSSRGYVLQIGDAAGENFGAPIDCVRSSYQPKGLALGQTVTVRVAVRRKGGQSTWSDVLAFTVR
jgi:hypothetical protein